LRVPLFKTHGEAIDFCDFGEYEQPVDAARQGEPRARLNVPGRAAGQERGQALA
jgi:hypothetical protein